MPSRCFSEIAPTVLPASLGAGRRARDGRQVRRVDARLSRRRRADARLRPSAAAEDGPSPVPRLCRRSLLRSSGRARAQGGRWSALDLETRRALLDAAFTKAGVRTPAAASDRPARRRRPDGVLLPQQRSERRLLQRADQPRGVPADRRSRSASPSRCDDNVSPAGTLHASVSFVSLCVESRGLTCLSTKPTSASSAAASPPRCSPSGSPSLRPGVAHHRRRSRPLDLRRAEPRPLSSSARIDYGEHPWHDDYIEDQQANGIISMTMAVGGLALHWGGACNRFSEEDLRLKSMYGLADRLADRVARARDATTCDAERRLNVSGEPSPLSRGPAIAAVLRRRRSRCRYNLQMLKTWAEQSGLKFSPLPMARNLTPFGGRGGCCVYDTCGEVCPSGARYSPDFTFQQLIAPKKITLHDRTLVRRLVLDEQRPTDRRRAGRASGSAERSDRVPREDVRRRVRATAGARTCCCCRRTRASRTASRTAPGLVGRYMNGHKFISARRPTSTTRRSPART